MTTQVNGLLAVLVLLTACGGAPTPVRIDPPAGAGRAAVELPPAPPGSPDPPAATAASSG